MTEEKLHEIFMHFDVDDTGYITKENIRDSMNKMGQALTSKEIDNALGVHDIIGDSRITFEEFKHMFVPNEQLQNKHNPLQLQK